MFSQDILQNLVVLQLIIKTDFSFWTVLDISVFRYFVKLKTAKLLYKSTKSTIVKMYQTSHDTLKNRPSDDQL